MLCGSGNCHCFHRWRNGGLNLSHLRNSTHAQQSKNNRHTFSCFSWMQLIPCLAQGALHDVWCILHTLYRARGVFRMSSYFVNVWCCKLFIQVLSVVKRYDVSWMEKATKWYVTIILIHSKFTDLWHWFNHNVHFPDVQTKWQVTHLQCFQSHVICRHLCIWLFYFSFLFLSLWCPLPPLQCPAWFSPL